ncbi:hypothetical protein DFR52_104453 [Hoeflea marina]|uniref:Stringent starvation protein B n=1 Tax=Hoeflea marina TaxID=274592 RepID=A0A317PIF0_9HYPH|nr:SspB family protein [Hoeflea marina]PWV99160.1 hypothetical protein DFR52_104453 [Hoeflea marina]
MPQDHIRYDILAQDALRGVIRKVLSEVAVTGYLPGEHHFFITFMTEAPGVRISTALKERYPEQMTIVVQHQFWELKVTESLFEIGLSFSDKPEKLVIPFSAIRGFYDPSVNFELEFDTAVEEAANDGGDEDMASAIDRLIEPAVTGDKSADGDAGQAGDGEAKPGADVVSLDAFRKKP